VRVFARISSIAFLILPSLPLLAQETPADPVLKSMQQELTHSFQNLKKTPLPPYFVSYQLADNRTVDISSSFGTIVSSSDSGSRLLDIDLRVGDYSLDNTHPLRGAEAGLNSGGETQQAMPLDDDADALRVGLWRATEAKYRQAAESYQRAKANVKVQIETEDKSGDFSPAPQQTHIEPVAQFSIDRAAWERRVRSYTAPFLGHADIIDSSAELDAEVETRRYVNSDGSEIRTSTPYYRITIMATAKASDGMELPVYQTYMSFHEGGLPDDATVLHDVHQMVDTLQALVKAPVAEPYSGPAILSGRASAVFFHEIFGHRIEGQRQKNEDEAQTFKKKVGQQVLPEFLSVYSDPGLQQIERMDLMGYYPFDDEGVKAQRVTVVEKGILKNFLMSRTPIEGFDHSNGHGRRQQGYNVAARQSNLIVVASQTVSREDLKRKLIAQINAAHKPYGLFFDDIEGGFTFTERSVPNAFNVRPTMVYRVYPDGREELVRGVDLIGTPLIAFSKIVAADDQTAVFNGVCGAESGWVPVSASSPGLLISEIEVQRKEKSQERPPILPPPSSVQEK
jgi:predicted Zn-dependent protease